MALFRLLAAFTIAVRLSGRYDRTIVRDNGVSPLGFGGSGRLGTCLRSSSRSRNTFLSLGWVSGSFVLRGLAFAGRLLLATIRRGPERKVVTEELHDKRAVPI